MEEDKERERVSERGGGLPRRDKRVERERERVRDTWGRKERRGDKSNTKLKGMCGMKGRKHQSEYERRERSEGQGR